MASDKCNINNAKCFTRKLLKPAVLTFLLLFAFTPGNTQVLVNARPAKFRVTGYLVASNIVAGAADDFDFSRITHLNIAFLNPGPNGNFPSFTVLNPTIAAAHAKHATVLASIGGGSAPVYYPTLLSDSMRACFIKNLVQLTMDYQLDGIDVDLEGPLIDNNYESFVTALSAALKQQGKILTAAVATVYCNQYTDKALAQFDFINIMSYDKTGPWKPSNPGQHSPYAMAVADLDYWNKIRGIAKNRLGLGLPFYGYGFGANAPADMSFKKIITQFPGAEKTDSVTVAGGGIIYYNGMAAIKAKTALALQNAGGIMIWQLMQDAVGKNSLLNIIDAAVEPKKQ